MKEIITERNIPEIIKKALSVLIYSSTAFKSPCAPIVFIDAIANEAPKIENIIETVVEVGKPNVLNISKSRTSANITATNIAITSGYVNMCGLNKPFLATSIIPPESSTPISIPTLAKISIIWRGATFEPIAEFRKLTASFATPNIKSEIASMKSTIKMKIK